MGHLLLGPNLSPDPLDRASCFFPDEGMRIRCGNPRERRERTPVSDRGQRIYGRDSNLPVFVSERANQRVDSAGRADTLETSCGVHSHSPVSVSEGSDECVGCCRIACLGNGPCSISTNAPVGVLERSAQRSNETSVANESERPLGSLFHQIRLMLFDM